MWRHIEKIVYLFNQNLTPFFQFQCCGVCTRSSSRENRKKMDKNSDLNLLPKCRLCGIVGHHKIDIFDKNLRREYDNEPSLREKIERCVDVRVSDD